MYEDLEGADFAENEENESGDVVERSQRGQIVSSFRRKLDTSSLDEEDDRGAPGNHSLSRLRLEPIVMSDTRLPDDAAPVLNPYASEVGSARGQPPKVIYQDKKPAFHRSDKRKTANDSFRVAPAFFPVQPKVAQPESGAFVYQRGQMSKRPLDWDRIDVASNRVERSGNPPPGHLLPLNTPVGSNTPSAAPFGHDPVMSVGESTLADQVVNDGFLSAAEMARGKRRKTEFELHNEEWLPASFSTSDAWVVNRFSEQSQSKFRIKTEHRIDDLDENGRYISGNRGDIKKRVMLGYFDMVHRREAEMARASVVYRQWLELPLSERKRLLEVSREPMTLDRVLATTYPTLVETTSVPGEYEKAKTATRYAARRLRLLRETAEEPSSAEHHPVASTDVSANVRHAGVLGDVDGEPSRQDQMYDLGDSIWLSRNSEVTIERILNRAMAQLDNVGSSRNTVLAAQLPPSRLATVNYSGNVAVHNTNDASPSRRMEMKTSGDQTNDTNRHFAELLKWDDSPLLRTPRDVVTQVAISGSDKNEMMRLATLACQQRGRVVSMRLDDAIPCTLNAIADRVFGGAIQEIQMHPGQGTALVVFVHPAEARSFLTHTRTVEQKGTIAGGRGMDFKASWFQGKEVDAIVKAQTHVLSHHIQNSATRCLKLGNIPPSKTYREVASDLATKLRKPIVFLQVQAPSMKHHMSADGRRLEVNKRVAVVEFASICDAVEAWQDFCNGQVYGYGHSDAEFHAERSTRFPSQISDCLCMSCCIVRHESDQGPSTSVREPPMSPAGNTGGYLPTEDWGF